MKFKIAGLTSTALLLLSPISGAVTTIAEPSVVQAENNWDYDTANSGLGEYDKLLQNAGPNDGQVDWYPTKSSLSSQPTAQELVHQLISLSIATNQANSQVRTALFNNTNGSNQKYDEDRQPYALAFSFIAQLLDFNNEKTGSGAYLQQHAVADEVNDPIDSQSNDVINREVQTEPAKGKGRNIADILGKAFFGNPDEAFAQIYLNGYDNTAQNAANIIRESTTSITIVAQSKLTGRKASAIFKLNNKTLPYQIRDSVLNNNIDGGIKATDSSYKTNGAQVANAEDWVTNANYSNRPTFWVDGSGKGTLVVPRGTTARQIAQMIAKLKIDSNYQMKTVAPMKAIQGNFAKGPGAPWLPQSEFNATDDSVSYNHAFIHNSNGTTAGSDRARWGKNLPNGDNAFIGLDPVNGNEVNNEFAKGEPGNLDSNIYGGEVKGQSWFANALDTNQYPDSQYKAKESAFKIPDFAASEGKPTFEVTQNKPGPWGPDAKQNSASNIGKVTHLFNPTRDQDANGKSMLREAWDAQHYAYALPELQQFANGQSSENQIEQLAQEISNNGSFQSAGTNAAIKKSFTYEAPVDAWVFKSYVNPYSTVMSSEGAKQPLRQETSDGDGTDGSNPQVAKGGWPVLGNPISLVSYWNEGNSKANSSNEVQAVKITEGGAWVGWGDYNGTVHEGKLASLASNDPSGTSHTNVLAKVVDEDHSYSYKFDNLNIGDFSLDGPSPSTSQFGTIAVPSIGGAEIKIQIPKNVTTWSRQGAAGINQLYSDIANEMGTVSDLQVNGKAAGADQTSTSGFLTAGTNTFGVFNPNYNKTTDANGKPLIKIADNHLNFVETYNTNTNFKEAASYPQKLATSASSGDMSGINYPNFRSMYKFSGAFSVLKYKSNFTIVNPGNSADEEAKIIKVGDKIKDSGGNTVATIGNNGVPNGQLTGGSSYTVERGGTMTPVIKMTFGETITQTNASKVAFFDSNLYNPHGDSNLPEDNYVSQDYSIGPAKLDSVSRNDYSDNGRYIGFKENGELDSSRTTAEDVVDSVAKRNRILGNSDSANKINDPNVNEGQNPNYKMVNLQDLDQPNTVYSGVTKAMKELYGLSEGKFLKASLPQKQVNAGTARINVVVYDQDKTAISTPAKAETKPSFSTTDVSTGNDPFNVNLRPYTTTYDDGAVLKGADVPQSFKNLLSNTLVAGNADLVDHPNRFEQVLVSAFLNSWQQNDGSFNQTDTGVGVNSPLYLYGGFGISNSDTKNSYSQWPNGYTTNTGDYLTATSHYSGDFYRGGKDLQLVRGGTVKGIPVSALKADVSKVDLSKAGTYPVVYTYTNPNNTKDSASITVPVTVKDAAAPVFAFQGGNDVTLHVGEPFDRTAYKVVGNWQIFNKSEGDYNKLVSGEGIATGSDGKPQVTITGEVDTNTPGVYQVTYEATNLSGIKAKMVRKINVLPKATGPDQSDWTVSVMKGVGYINYTPGYGINVWNAPAGTFTGQRLNHGTSWKIFQKAVNRQGKVYYNVGKNQWLDGQYVSFTPVSTMQRLTGVVTINYVPGYGVNLWKAPKTTGGYHEGRKLPHGTQWKVFGIQDGFYKVGGNQWIQAKYAKFQAR